MNLSNETIPASLLIKLLASSLFFILSIAAGIISKLPNVSLDKFITSSKAHRFRLYNTNEIYMRTIDVRYNQKLRNAIGHNDVEYETSTQKIIYIPDPRKREKKLSEYLLEFEIEALSMFKTVLVISEYLYRLRELELLSKGVKPLPVEFPTKERRKEKIYPNEKCPCGSGLKYKKCHGRIF